MKQEPPSFSYGEVQSEYERISARKAHNALCFSFGENEPNYFVLSEKEFLKYVELLREGL